MDTITSRFINTRLVIGLAFLFAGNLSLRAQTKIEYNRDVRPILAENCFNCHGPDSASRKAGLRLDRRADAIDAGVIVPGKADESELVSRVHETNKNKVMPPPKTLKALTKVQKDTLRRWINEGAE